MSIDLMVGLRPVSFERDGDDTVIIHCDGGKTLRLWLEADCCSSSVFADMDQFAALCADGGVIAEAEGRALAEIQDDWELVRPYCVVIKTTNGHHTIDWRNTSNGYYDGTLRVSLDGA